MFVRQMHGNPFEDAAISPHSGEADVLCGECKIFMSNNLRNTVEFLAGVHLTTAINEQLVVELIVRPLGRTQ